MAGQAQRTSKFKFDSSLFNPEPPIAPTLIKALFVGRARELKGGCETLRANLDVKGRRSQNHDKRPWVIHGESRSGKSHLARRILAGLTAGKKRMQLIVPAKE